MPEWSKGYVRQATALFYQVRRGTWQCMRMDADAACAIP
jgi:hypothetical protein